MQSRDVISPEAGRKPDRIPIARLRNTVHWCNSPYLEHLLVVGQWTETSSLRPLLNLFFCPQPSKCCHVGSARASVLPPLRFFCWFCWVWLPVAPCYGVLDKSSSFQVQRVLLTFHLLSLPSADRSAAMWTDPASVVFCTMIESTGERHWCSQRGHKIDLFQATNGDFGGSGV